MVEYSDINSATYGTIQFNLHGDGTGTIIKVNVSKPPFNVNFNGVIPSSIAIDPIDPDGLNITGTATMEVDGNGDNIMTVTYSQAIPEEPQTCTATFRYPTLA